MPDRTANTLKLLGVLVTLILAIASPIVAVSVTNAANSFTANAAMEKADKAIDKANFNRELSEKNARDFEYFKGEMTATMKAHKDGLDKMDRKMDKQDTKLDELIKIMSGFMRADDE